MLVTTRGGVGKSDAFPEVVVASCSASDFRLQPARPENSANGVEEDDDDEPNDDSRKMLGSVDLLGAENEGLFSSFTCSRLPSPFLTEVSLESSGLSTQRVRWVWRDWRVRLG